jgi:hypothetical protein
MFETLALSSFWAAAAFPSSTDVARRSIAASARVSRTLRIEGYTTVTASPPTAYATGVRPAVSDTSAAAGAGPERASSREGTPTKPRAVSAATGASTRNDNILKPFAGGVFDVEQSHRPGTRKTHERVIAIACRSSS